MADDRIVAFGSGAVTGAIAGGIAGSIFSRKDEQHLSALAEVSSSLKEAISKLQDAVSRFNEAVTRLEAATGILSQETLMKSATISLPIDFINLGRLIQSFGVPGEVEFLLYSTPVTIPARTEMTFVIEIPSGFVGAFVEPVRIYSDYYSKDITGRIIVDNIKVVTPIPYYLTEAAVISLGEWYIARQNLTIKVNNGSAVDITMTGQAQVILMQVSFYEEWFRPVISASWEVINNLAELMGGKKR